MKIYSILFLIMISISVNASDDFDDFESEFVIEKKSDPFSGYNRIITDFNDGFYTHLVKPVAVSYGNVVHKDIRSGIDRVFDNLYFPVRFLNNLLQGKFLNAWEETQRFCINTTFGILGFNDIAKKEFNIKKHNEDFGQTLGFYGVGSGPHIVLPLLGPSNLRDTISIIPDSYLSPIDYEERTWYTFTDSFGEYIAVRGYDKLNNYSLNVERYDNIKKNAIDLYPYLKSIYEQHRQKLIEE